MVHIDPFRATDSTLAISNYNNHRDGFLWYLNLADSLGVKLSTQATGVYAEACVRQGHWSDFTTSMPGGSHHFGTHVHPKVKTGPPYVWRDPPMDAWDDPDTVRTVMADNFPWLNEIFTRNGFPIAANDFFHGSSAHYDGMDTVLWCPPTSIPLPYPNCFKMGDGLRGGLWVYRGPFGMEPHERPDTSYLKIPEVGGIIGFNEVHGPEGFVPGELPFQKRDFLRAYLEWREMVRRGERSAVRHFTWMIHPYQLVPGYLGSDSVPVRDTIIGLIEWLNSNWIGQADESGYVMAGYANAEEIRDHYDTWRAAHPVEEDSLEAKLADNQRPLYLPGIYDRLITCYYVDELAYADTNVTVHEFADTTGDWPVYALWTHADSTTLDSTFTGPYEITYGDGSTQLMPASLIVIRTEPILIEPLDLTGVSDRSRAIALALSPAFPNPFNPAVRLDVSVGSAAPVNVRIYNVRGQFVTTLLSKRLNAGTYPVTWDGTDARGRAVASGVYFVRAVAAGKSTTRKVVLLK
jgi:hypothetical protein